VRSGMGDDCAEYWFAQGDLLVRFQKMITNDAAATHFESLARILRELAKERIELFEHTYHPQAFGSFELILGRGHDQLQFIWDGKEATLSVSFAKIPHKNTVPNWTHDAD
jgi:hypothetical protein